MRILIGVDEAGYGPNYGPLCVAASAWGVDAEGEGGRGKGELGRKRVSPRVSGSQRAGASSSPGADPQAGAAIAATTDGAREACDLYDVLSGAVVRSPSQCARRIAIADSKLLYKPGGGLAGIERGVMASLVAGARGSGTLPANNGDFLAAVCANEAGRRRELECHWDDATALPAAVVPDDALGAGRRLDGACREQGAAPLGVRARLVFAAQFNELVDRYGTKGAALSHVTLGLVRQIVDHSCDAAIFANDGCAAGPAAGVHVTLDKHGGRNHYAALVQHHFPESWIDVVVEGRSASCYRWQHRGTTVEATFRVGGEAALETALASMTAKYLRELSMRAFNAFWAARVPALRPTAGYPVDSHRFRDDIASTQRKLGIADRDLWRSR